jgi:hypothetical protein
VLKEALKRLGFDKANADDCLYVLWEDSGDVGLIALVYVDDMAVTGPKLTHIEAFKKKVAECFSITNKGKLDFIVGIQVKNNPANHCAYVNQTAYIREILTQFGMNNCAPQYTPLALNSRLSAADSPTTDDKKRTYLDFAKGINYLEVIGAILWVTQTRPDIQHAAGVLAQFGANPSKAHLKAAKRVLRYLKATVHYLLCLGGKVNEVTLVSWTNSD